MHITRGVLNTVIDSAPYEDTAIMLDGDISGLYCKRKIDRSKLTVLKVMVTSVRLAWVHCPGPERHSAIRARGRGTVADTRSRRHW